MAEMRSVSVLLIFVTSLSRVVNSQDDRQYRATTMEAIMNVRTNTQVGAEVRGMLLDELADRKDTIDILKQQLFNQRILVFRGQDILDTEDLRDLGLLLGKALDDSHKHHSMDAGIPEVFVTSNSPDGEYGVSIKDGLLWHIGGFHYEQPYSISIFQMTKVSKKSPIVFVPLDDVYASLSDEKKAEWNRIWIRCGHDQKVVHPFIHHHPKTDLETMCFDIEGMHSIIYEHGTPDEWVATDKQLDRFQEDVMMTLMEDNGKWHYTPKWNQGDIIIVDNMSVGQLYPPRDLLESSEIGVYIMKRVNVMGRDVPAKRPGTVPKKQEKLSDEPGDPGIDIEPNMVYKKEL